MSDSKIGRSEFLASLLQRTGVSTLPLVAVRTQTHRMRRVIAGVIVLVGMLIPVRAQAWGFGTHLQGVSDLDTFVADQYDGLTNSGCFFPPGPFYFDDPCGVLTFRDGSDIAVLTNTLPMSDMFGIPAYRISVVEMTQGTSRVWYYLGADGIAVRTNNAPASMNEQEWVRQAYRHDPPWWLVDEPLSQWYAHRDRCRISLIMTLINSNDWNTLLELEASIAATNVPVVPSGPVMPADSNWLAFAGIVVAESQVQFWIYTPSNRPVALLSTETLTGPTNAWTFLGNMNATPQFNQWQTECALTNTFFRAGYTDLDRDGDRIPDLLELYVFGTNPDSTDSDGDGFSDYEEIFVYGTDPWNPDAEPPSVTIINPGHGEWKAVLP